MRPHYHENALLVFAHVPEIARGTGDNQLAVLPWEDLDLLFTAFLGDLVRTATQLDATDILLYRKPDELSDDFFLPFRQKVRTFDLNDTPILEQVQLAVERAFRDGYHRVIVVLENHPLISLATLKRVFDQLRYEDDCLVIGLTGDGRCLLVGMKMNHSELFHAMDGNPIADSNLLMQRICDSGGMLFPIPSTYTVDSPVKLYRLREDVRAMDRRNPDFPSRTFEAFKIFDKKYYRIRRVFR